MVTLSNAGRIAWLIVMTIATISVAVINNYAFGDSDLGVWISVIPLIVVSVPIHMSTIYPSIRKP